MRYSEANCKTLQELLNVGYWKQIYYPDFVVTTEVSKKKYKAFRMLEFWEPLYDDGYAIDRLNENGSALLFDYFKNLIKKIELELLIFYVNNNPGTVLKMKKNTIFQVKTPDLRNLTLEGFKKEVEDYKDQAENNDRPSHKKK